MALATLAVAATVGGVTGTLVQTGTARAQRDFALRQVERSEALKDFHEFLLSDAAPSGKPFTVNDLLARAEHIVERQHADDDPTRVMLMTSIGRQYLAQDEGASARRVLELAYILSRSVSDRSIRAQASLYAGSAAGSRRTTTVSRAALPGRASGTTGGPAIRAGANRLPSKWKRDCPRDWSYSGGNRAITVGATCSREVAFQI